MGGIREEYDYCSWVMDMWEFALFYLFLYILEIFKELKNLAKLKNVFGIVLGSYGLLDIHQMQKS